MKHIRPHSFGPHSPLSSRLPHVDPLACRDLWGAVLLGVLRDLCTAQPQSVARDAAEAWVGDWPRRDFRSVCHLAGIEPGWLHGALFRLVSRPVEERRERIAAMFDQGTGTSEMPQAFATEGHAVSMSMVWNDIRHLRAAGRIGYLREPHAPQNTTTSGVAT